MPLFPLSTVLFPDGVLPLQVFEVRYLDMISRCIVDGTPFGVVLLTSGHEVRKADAGQERFVAAGTIAGQCLELGLLDGDGRDPAQLVPRLEQRRRGHDRGEVLRDLAVMVADGGTRISDLAVLRNQAELFDGVASTPTACRRAGWRWCGTP